MAASTLSRVTPVILAARTAIRLDTMRSTGTEPQYINLHKKDPVAKTAGYIQFDNVSKKHHEYSSIFLMPFSRNMDGSEILNIDKIF